MSVSCLVGTTEVIGVSIDERGHGNMAKVMVREKVAKG
jgi:hypothetical protein